MAPVAWRRASPAAAVVAVRVLTAVAWAPTLGRGLAAQPSKPSCTEDPSTYPQSADCTSGAAFWEQEVTRLSVTAGAVKCMANPVTGKIECKAAASCTSEQWKSEQVATAYTYDCESQCGSSKGMLESCCAECLAEEVRGKKVVCTGCPESPARRLSVLNEWCTLTEQDGFKCQKGTSCSVGVPIASNESLACQVLPCDTCSDNLLKAECCKQCLGVKCGAAARTFCQGCDPVSTATGPLSPTAISTGSSNGSLWTMMLTVVTCIGIVASLAVLILLFLQHRQHHLHHHGDESSSEEDKLVPVAVTIMPPQAQQNYQVHPTNWQAWEPASMKQPAGMPVHGAGMAAHMS